MTTLSPKRPRLLKVQSWQDLSPHLRRIVFHSADLADYPFQCNGAHIKLFLPLPGQDAPQLPLVTAQGPQWADKADKPIARTYTLRSYDAAACTLSVDFVLHGDNGPASRFALAAAPGMCVGISPPAGPVPMLKAAAHYLLAGDLSALPAIESMLHDMAPAARGDVLLWLPERADLRPLPLPAAVRLHSFFGDAGQHAAFIDTLRQCRPSTDDCFVWLAGEASLVADARALARQQWQIPLARCYAVPYWRRGQDEETYHQARHDFMDSDGA